MGQESDDSPESPRRWTAVRSAGYVRRWVPVLATVITTGIAVYGAVTGHGPSQ